jgi:hypothetical protein
MAGTTSGLYIRQSHHNVLILLALYQNVARVSRLGPSRREVIRPWQIGSDPRRGTKIALELKVGATVFQRGFLTAPILANTPPVSEANGAPG